MVVIDGSIKFEECTSLVRTFNLELFLDKLIFNILGECGIVYNLTTKWKGTSK
jgi:hypothetical protein